MPPVGAHIQIKGGLAKGGLTYTDAVAARAVQVFVGNPRGWRLTDGDPEQDALFTAGCAERGVPSFIHTPFLVNVGSPTEATVEQSIAAIEHNLRRGARLGCQGVVVHAGSAVGEDRYEAALRQLHERLLPVLEAAPADGPRLLIEPTAGGGKALAATVEDLGPYFAALEDHPLLGVCFDTCHVWAAGHDLSVPGGMSATLDAVEATVGPGRLGLVHVNDSLDECGSKRDRHTTIGAGTISGGAYGTGPFAELMRHRTTAGVPMVVETPSLRDGDPCGGHAADIALLNSLRDAVDDAAA
ncbi:endonuclease IV with intrinsic 3'-5' exonuclease activity [Blastococcus saxobsidens DD2]|uniref:Probable endonuclease 4 n=1 Tax=Blastococcus saxobsidens (strain DD2) TaxID=1146883 RepID=H6RSV1_BLASD|nr:endonuclease IV with intrinsic 3'-5' exonuclease activity [Blastococcus saxobsidens DD2]